MASVDLWLLVAYFGLMAALSVFGLHRYSLVYLYYKHRKSVLGPPARRFRSLPRVTVQLPIYNERFVVEDLLEAACGLRYPRPLLQVQVLDDADDVLAYAADPEWSRFLPVPQPYERQHAEEAVARWVLKDWSTEPDWAIEVAGRASGEITLRINHRHRSAALGYALARRHWGRGYMTEAGRAVIDAAFASLPELARVHAGAYFRNQASIRVMQKLGMTHEGTIRHAPKAVRLEANSAGVIYAVLREEWEQAAGRPMLAPASLTRPTGSVPRKKPSSR